MTLPRLSNLEMRIMEICGRVGLSVAKFRKISRQKPAAYTTVQTMVQRLEAKNAVRRVRKISTAFIFEAAIPRDAARRRLMTNSWPCSGASPSRS